MCRQIEGIPSHRFVQAFVFGIAALRQSSKVTRKLCFDRSEFSLYDSFMRNVCSVAIVRKVAALELKYDLPDELRLPKTNPTRRRG